MRSRAVCNWLWRMAMYAVDAGDLVEAERLVAQGMRA